MSLGLIADIGGTNARFALIDADGGVLDSRTLAVRAFADPVAAAHAFLDGRQAAAGAFAVACPVDGDEIAFTNSPWRFSTEQARTALGLSRLTVVNDFAAVAWSVPHLAASDLLPVGGGAPVAGAPVAVLGPGTGLGVSLMVPRADGGGWQVLPTEGGHVTLAAADEDEDRVLMALRHRFGHASAERALSGPGLSALYQAVAEIRVMEAEPLPPDQVAARAMDRSDPLCVEALGLFFSFLGTVAGNLVLSAGARGGVYLAGGILPRMADALRASRFRSRFEAKGRFSAYLAPVPVKLITHKNPAFLGLSGLVGEGDSRDRTL